MYVTSDVKCCNMFVSYPCICSGDKAIPDGRVLWTRQGRFAHTRRAVRSSRHERLVHSCARDSFLVNDGLAICLYSVKGGIAIGLYYVKGGIAMVYIQSKVE